MFIDSTLVCQCLRSPRIVNSDWKELTLVGSSSAPRRRWRGRPDGPSLHLGRPTSGPDQLRALVDGPSPRRVVCRRCGRPRRSRRSPGMVHLDVDLGAVAGANPFGDLSPSPARLLARIGHTARLDFGAERHEFGEVDPLALTELGPQFVERHLDWWGLSDRVARAGGRHKASVAPCCARVPAVAQRRGRFAAAEESTDPNHLRKTREPPRIGHIPTSDLLDAPEPAWNFCRLQGRPRPAVSAISRLQGELREFRRYAPPPLITTGATEWRTTGR